MQRRKELVVVRNEVDRYAVEAVEKSTDCSAVKAGHVQCSAVMSE